MIISCWHCDNKEKLIDCRKLKKFELLAKTIKWLCLKCKKCGVTIEYLKG